MNFCNEYRTPHPIKSIWIFEDRHAVIDLSDGRQTNLHANEGFQFRGSKYPEGKIKGAWAETPKFHLCVSMAQFDLNFFVIVVE
jgi:hypothetical protein